MRKVTYICDLCGKEYKHENWTLECDTFFIDDYSTNRKTVMHICKDCAKWIKKQRNKGGDDE